MPVHPVVVITDPTANADDAVTLAAWEAARRGTEVQILPAEEAAAVDAAMLVVAAWPQDANGLVRTASCPVAVLGTSASARPVDAPVLLLVDRATEREVIAFAFAAAAAHGAGVIAVRTWEDDRACMDLTHKLCAFMPAYPQVGVDSTVAVDGLLNTLAGKARLVVAGRSMIGTLASLPALPCPVVIVPPPRPVHFSWLGR
jgi:hypothetical protein